MLQSNDGHTEKVKRQRQNMQNEEKINIQESKKGRKEERKKKEEKEQKTEKDRKEKLFQASYLLCFGGLFLFGLV